MNNLYQDIINVIDNLENIFIEHKHEKIQEFNTNAIQIIRNFKKQNIQDLEFLNNNQEWDSFTIAFYGETNAGKSTLIESLRIYYGESKKLEEQKNFTQCIEDIENSNIRLEIIETQISNKLKELENLNKELQKEKQRIKGNVFFALILSRLGIKYLKYRKLIKNLNTVKKVMKSKVKEKKKLSNDIEALHDKLKRCQDGAIIGDGRSDFTKNISAYRIRCNNKKVILLDIPGIEGNEQVVMDEILRATSKAHAIFYIKKEPTPPQKGDGNAKGTIDKIKEHLSAHTEVYTIYNKPISNPRALRDGLVNANEIESINILNKHMTEILKDSYQGCKFVSAQAAFYGLAEYLRKDSGFYKQKNKFLEKYSSEELLQISKFYEFADFIDNDLINNSINKIKKVNYNKALYIINQFIENITYVNNNIKSLSEDFKKMNNDTNKSIDQLVRNFIDDIKNIAHFEIDKLIQAIRKEMYRAIDQDINNNVKMQLEKTVQSKINIFTKKLEKRFRKLSSNLENNIKQEIKKLQKKLDTVLDYICNLNLGKKFDFDIEIENGINVKKLVEAILGIAAAIAVVVNMWNPVGWSILVLSVITGVIKIYKSIRGFFSKSYKKSQQKQYVDERLLVIRKKIERDMDKYINEIEQKILSLALEIKHSLYESVIQINIIKKNLNQSKDYLLTIAKRIEGEMNNE